MKHPSILSSISRGVSVVAVLSSLSFSQVKADIPIASPTYKSVESAQFPYSDITKFTLLGIPISSQMSEGKVYEINMDNMKMSVSNCEEFIQALVTKSKLTALKNLPDLEGKHHCYSVDVEGKTVAYVIMQKDEHGILSVQIGATELFDSPAKFLKREYKKGAIKALAEAEIEAYK